MTSKVNWVPSQAVVKQAERRENRERTCPPVRVTPPREMEMPTGYGHGVGMSQYGANAMAKSGSGFEDILKDPDDCKEFKWVHWVL